MTSASDGVPQPRSAPRGSDPAPSPLWGVGAVSSLLGIATPTLRTWDRRYGLGPSQRTEGGHRRYSEADIARVELMSRLLERGVPAHQAATVAITTADSELDAPLDGSSVRVAGHLPGDFSGNLPGNLPTHVGTSGRATASAVAALVAAAEVLDTVALSRQLASLFERRGVVGGWSDVAVPALRVIGERWSTGELGVESEHLASERVATELRGLVRRSNVHRSTSQPVLLAGAPGDHHALPLIVVEAALAQRRVLSITLGPNTTPLALATAVARTEPRAVFAWASLPCELSADWLAHWPPADPPRLLVLGGPGWALTPIAVPPGLNVTRVHDLPEALAALDLAA